MERKAIILLEKFEVGYYLFRKSPTAVFEFLTVNVPDDVEEFGGFVRTTVLKYTGGETVNVDYKKSFSYMIDGVMTRFMVFDACCYTGVKSLALPYVAHSIIEFKDVKSFIDPALGEYLTCLKTASKKILRPAPPMTKGQKRVVKRVSSTSTSKVKTNPSILRALKNQ